jgi:D-3-phosphoglycerate dehydrogenase
VRSPVFDAEKGNMDYHILVSDSVHERGVDILASRPGFKVDVNTGLSAEGLKEIIGKYHGLVIRSATKVTGEILDAATNLKVIGRAGTGLDNVDIPSATMKGVVVMNTPGGNSVAAAEHTIGMIMAAHRHIPQAVASMKAGKWEKKKFQGREMAGKTLGVIGLGKIGSHVSRLASRGLKMKVIGYDPMTSPEVASQCGTYLTTLDEILKSADIITVHTPLNDDTRSILDSRAFSVMKDGVIVINCARGGIVDETALLENLESEKVAVAALDVFSISPPGNHPLVTHPRVIATPHLGASTDEAQINVAVAVAQQIGDYLETGAIRNAVNVPGIDVTLRAKVGPYLDLAQRLAQFLGGLSPRGVIEIALEYQGEIATWDVEPITNAALVGFLTTFEGQEVNQVNASLIARERGIRVLATTTNEGSEYGSSIVIRTRFRDGTSHSVQGALIRRMGYEPRIIGIDEFVTEAVPAGSMLIITNEDIPGMIAGMAGALAASGINIAQMNLSRDVAGGSAMSILNIDSPGDDVTLETIRGIPGILSVTQVVLDT